MSNADVQPTLEPLIKAVRVAARLSETIQALSRQYDTKSRHKMVTIADYGVQAILQRTIREYFPADGIIAEESHAEFMRFTNRRQRKLLLKVLGEELGSSVSADDLSDWLSVGRLPTAPRQWVIDPIDGTSGFVAGRSYTIALGLLVAGRPRLGIMGSPRFFDRHNADFVGRLFCAYEGVAYMDDLAGGAWQVVRMPELPNDPLHIVGSFSRKHNDFPLLTRIYEGLRMPYETFAINGQEKYAMVALGFADLHLRIPADKSYRQKVWDHAAGVAFLNAAGGRVSDERGAELDFSAGEHLRHHRMIFASHPRLHQTLIERTQEILNHEEH